MPVDNSSCYHYTVLPSSADILLSKEVFGVPSNTIVGQMIFDDTRIKV